MAPDKGDPRWPLIFNVRRRDVVGSYRLSPSFSSCMRWGLAFVLVLMTSLIGLTAIIRTIYNQPFPQHWSEAPGELALISAALAIGMGTIVFAVLFALSADATKASLRASTYWGRRVTIPWSSITSVTAWSYQGLPALIIESDVSKAELYIYTLGLNRREVHSQLCRLAGPSNMLTKCFAGGS